MKEIRINLLDVNTLDARPAQLRIAHVQLPVSYLVAACSVFFILVGTGVFSYQISKNENSGLNKTIRVISGISHFVTNAERQLSGESEDRINIALLGIGGAGHDGGQLTDTIIVLSIQPSTHRAALISIPRDLLVNIEGYGLRKINNASAFGENQQEGRGAELTQKVLAQTLNIPIQYYIRVDFKAFKEIVDTVGGLSVNVDNSFTDYTYPTDELGHVGTISFKAGPQNMDGDAALKYGRSRHSGMNNEGSDFARSHRQQKLLVALKEKLLSTDVLLKPQKISDIINSLQTHVSTNLESWEILKLAQIAKDIDTSHLGHLVLDDAPDGYLYPENIGGAYVLQPKGGNFNAIDEKVAQIFQEPLTTESSETITARKPRVIVKNGTTTAGLAGRTAEELKTKGFTIMSFGNAVERNQSRTVIYDLSKGMFEEQKKILSKELNHAPIANGDGAEQDQYKTYADFMVVIGADLSPTPPPPAP